jgi:hypothetical protein
MLEELGRLLFYVHAFLQLFCGTIKSPNLFIINFSHLVSDNKTLFVSFQRERRKFVTFTVELQRDGGPLGLTLATEGNADLPGPIYISSLQEDGLAHRTRLI